MVDTFFKDQGPVKRIKITLTDTVPKHPNGTIWVEFSGVNLLDSLKANFTEFFFRYFSGYRFVTIFGGSEIRNVTYNVTLSFELGFDPYIKYDVRTNYWFGGNDAISLCSTCPRITLAGNLDTIQQKKFDALEATHNMIFVHSTVIGEADFYSYHWQWAGFNSGVKERFDGHKVFLDGKVDARCYIYPINTTKDSIRTAVIVTNLFTGDKYYSGKYIVYDKSSSLFENSNITGVNFLARKDFGFLQNIIIKNFRFSAHNNMKDDDFYQRAIFLLDYDLKTVK
ncbi:MAG: hypothetical protein QM726_04190 [Chitinophagaceae bacterium]